MDRRKEKIGRCTKSAHYMLTGLLILLLSAGLTTPDTVRAEEGAGPDAEVGSGPGKDRFKVYFGGYFPNSNTDMKVDIGDTEINLEDVLDLSESTSVWRLGGYWRFAKKHRLAFGYYSLDRDASKSLERDFHFDGKDWTVGALVETDLSLDFYQINYQYSFIQGEKWEIAGSLGGYWVKAKLDMFASASVNDQSIVGQRTSESVEGPLPLIGLVFDYYITPKWLATVKGGYFQLKIDELDGRLMNLGASVEYQFTKYFGLGLGYDGFWANVTSDSSDDIDISEIDYNYHGIQVFGILRF